MSSRIRVIASIVKKDVLSLWPVILATVSLVLVWTGFQVVHPVGYQYSILRTLLPVISGAGSVLLLFLIVQQDPAAGSRHDWRTRPIRKLDLLLAKHVLIIAGVLAPWLLYLVITDLAAGHAFAEVFLDRIGLVAFLLLTPAIVAFAAMAENLLGSLIAIAASAAAIVVAGAGLSYKAFGPAFNIGLNTPVTKWIASDLGLVLVCALGCLVLWQQFARNRLWLSRASMMAGAFAIVCVLAFAIPFNTVWAAYKAVAPETDLTRAITLQIENTCLSKAPSRFRLSGSENMAIGSISQRISGIPSDHRLVVERIEASTTNGGAMLTSQFVDILDSVSSRRSGAWYFTDYRSFGRLRPDDALHLTYRLTLMKPTSRFEVPIDGVRRKIEGFGWCTAEQMTVNVNRIDCFKTGAQPDLILVSNASDSTISSVGGANYQPSLLEALGGRRYLRVVARSSASPNAPVMVSTYQAKTHFDRTATAPLRLSNTACEPSGGNDTPLPVL